METTTARPTVLSRDEIVALPVDRLGPIEGVGNQVLWRNATSTAGVLTVERGRRLGMHSHRVNHHHMWVLEGSADIVGRRLGPGSYVHIPSGYDNDIDATST
jgi:hypothetical protein